jgi:hypothetical protein
MKAGERIAEIKIATEVIKRSQAVKKVSVFGHFCGLTPDKEG